MFSLVLSWKNDSSWWLDSADLLIIKNFSSVVSLLTHVGSKISSLSFEKEMWKSSKNLNFLYVDVILDILEYFVYTTFSYHTEKNLFCGRIKVLSSWLTRCAIKFCTISTYFIYLCVVVVFSPTFFLHFPFSASFYIRDGMKYELIMFTSA